MCNRQLRGRENLKRVSKIFLFNFLLFLLKNLCLFSERRLPPRGGSRRHGFCFLLNGVSSVLVHVVCVVILIVLSSDDDGWLVGWSANGQETRLRNFNDLVHRQVWVQINTYTSCHGEQWQKLQQMWENECDQYDLNNISGKKEGEEAFNSDYWWK